MFRTIFTVEIKKIFRDKMTAFLVFYPVIMGSVGKYLVENPDQAGGEDMVFFVMSIFSIIGAYMFGALLGLTMIEDREDRVFESVRITPVSIHYYIWIRTVFVMIMGFIGNMFVMTLTSDIETQQMILISLVSTLQIPVLTFFINTVAANKVEGFVAMKGSSFLFIIPIVAALFFNDVKEFLFSFAPGFWSAKATQSLIFEKALESAKPAIDAGLVEASKFEMVLSFEQYIIIGLVYGVILTSILYIRFTKKENL